ncbi:hypothetical protein CHLNCDRAFT_133791 [Chlorella variabilis]|uniref:Myb-like domain-containing protein n=1 Tax=Chlorella variabilis TaxID=554065 RepID=E1ZF86_CHLVA|nr:hypothetical protein CHLNCDRAFT_133791 [Chlorella variabilis]EFN55627.1 hypothetical protein CHLNCDRAFT_133791 [Chlorella variabilis]|eukprot:XP_005847729.1 hypothetical protein CHLNCDRAFT_133791 [Chlorella variabilis]
MATAAEGPQQHAAPPHGNQQEAADRLEWVKQMRSAFSPEGMCKADGEVDQDFFKPKNIIIRLKDDEKWGAAQKEALYKGLERYGVGKWREMINSFPELSRYKDTDVRVHAGRLLGAQSLARHVGWKGDRAAVDAQRELHLRIAGATSCLKNGVLVENDEGSVARYLEQHPEVAAQIGAPP